MRYGTRICPGRAHWAAANPNPVLLAPGQPERALRRRCLVPMFAISLPDEPAIGSPNASSSLER